MKGVIMSAYGKNEVVSIAEVAKPAVGANEVLIQVVAASLNPLDFKIHFTDRGLARPA